MMPSRTPGWFGSVGQPPSPDRPRAYRSVVHSRRTLASAVMASPSRPCVTTNDGPGPRRSTPRPLPPSMLIASRSVLLGPRRSTSGMRRGRPATAAGADLAWTCMIDPSTSRSAAICRSSRVVHAIYAPPVGVTFIARRLCAMTRRRAIFYGWVVVAVTAVGRARDGRRALGAGRVHPVDDRGAGLVDGVGVVRGGGRTRGLRPVGAAQRLAHLADRGPGRGA